MDRPSSNRSPSPLSNVRPNPNSRNSESNSSLRRSYSGNPFGGAGVGKPSALANPRFPNPINSPADQLRRHSLGKEGAGTGVSVHDEKENEKGARFRSPAKGSKNFMSPTISAASKFTPSPRKKVLAERNEIVRTSIQFSDFQGSGLMEDSCVKPEKMLDQVKTEEGLFDSKVDQKEMIVPSVPQVTLDSDITEKSDSVNCHTKTVSFSTNSPTIIAPLDVTLYSDITEKSDSVNCHKKTVSFSTNSPTIIAPLDDTLDSEITEKSDSVICNKKSISFSTNSPIIAPLDADPSQPPPYDPKTNFLSPRPQFLHYRPNPRIEVFLNKEEGVEFGDFGGMNLEDSFIMSEESQSEDSPKESEDLSSSETTSEEEGEPIMSEPIPLSTPISTPISTPVPELSFEAKKSPKPRFFMRAVSVSLLLVFLVACVSIAFTDSPVMDSSVLQGISLPNLYDPSEVAAFAKSSLTKLDRTVRQWSANSISYLSGLVPQFSQSNEFGPIQFFNLTAVPPQDDLLVNRHIGVNLSDDEFEETAEVEEWEMVSEEQDEDEVESIEDQPVLEAPVLEPEVAEILEVESVDVEPEVAEILEVESVDVEPEVEVLEFQSKQEVNDVVGPEFVAADFASPAVMEPTFEDNKVELSSEIAPSEPLPSTLDATADKFSLQNIVGVSLLVSLLAAATIFLYLRQRKSGASSAVTPELPKEPVVVSKQESQNWETEVEEVAESCPSEMSSFQKSTSYTKRVLRETSEAQSQEKRPRTNYKRESLASSSSEFSMGSLSYGSFTTYERIPIKKASGEEEIVTPVRRSSRIRNHVISP